jgi:hypothetical protein
VKLADDWKAVLAEPLVYWRTRWARSAGPSSTSVVDAAVGSVDYHALFWGETVAVLAFGLSWFLKGSELFNILREEHGLPPILRPPDPNERAQSGAISPKQNLNLQDARIYSPAPTLSKYDPQANIMWLKLSDASK